MVQFKPLSIGGEKLDALWLTFYTSPVTLGLLAPVSLTMVGLVRLKPVGTRVEITWCQRLKLAYEVLLSSLGFNVRLHPCMMEWDRMLDRLFLPVGSGGYCSPTSSNAL